MPLDFQFEFTYPFEPSVNLLLRSPLTRQLRRTSAHIDTGADRTIFDMRLAIAIGLDLSTADTVRIMGLAGVSIEGAVMDVELLLLGEEDLQVMVPVIFAPSQAVRVGNLIGLDVLEHFDFGLSHRHRLGYLGRPEP